MKTEKNHFKKIALLSLSCFLIAIVGCLYVQPAFFIFAGCGAGYLWQICLQKKKKLPVARLLPSLITGASAAVLLTGLIGFYFQQERSIYYILPFACILLAVTAYYVIKKLPQETADYPEAEK